MYWLEVSVQAEREAVEAISGIFAEYCYGGVAIEEDITPAHDGDGYAYNLGRPLTVRAYIPVDDQAGEKVERLRSTLDHLSFLRPIGPLHVRRLAEEDWANAWKEHYHVQRVGRRMVIVPTWRDYQPAADDVVIRLDPGMAFGTGLHPTTRACLERLEDTATPGMSVLDVGTGSGILALAAARLGATRVLALDVDPLAVAAAQANVGHNGLGRVIEVHQGSLPLARLERFDIVVANIIARVIAELAPALAQAMRPGGVLIASGIIAERAAMVEESLQQAGLRLLRRDADGDWITLTLVTCEKGLEHSKENADAPRHCRGRLLLTNRDVHVDRRLSSASIRVPFDHRISVRNCVETTVRAKMHRFFVPAEWLTGGNVTVGGPLVHQMRRVLRLRPGEHVIFLDNSGWEVEAEIVSLHDDRVEATVRSKRLGAREPRTKITLYQSLLKGDSFGQVLQKCTEVGIVEFVPVVSERCIVGDVDRTSERYRRWQRIIIEAAEQSHRSKAPLLRPATLLANALESVSGRGLSVVPWEEEHTTSLRSVLAQKTVVPSAQPQRSRSGAQPPPPRRPFAINIFIGPEGGFTPSEIAIARQYGAIPVTLGPRILRAETAGLVAATIILHEMGDMG